MLTDLAIRKAQPKSSAFKLHDSQGLYLYVTPKGTKVWRVDHRASGKRQTSVIGRYPDVGLGEARRRRDEIKSGPAPERITFGAVADEYLSILRDRDPPIAAATLIRWERILTKTTEVIRSKPIREVTSADVLDLMKRLGDTGRRETAHRVRSSISTVFRHAIATLRAENDPTYVLRGAVQPPKVKHMSAITEEREFGVLLTSIEEARGWWSVRLYLQFLALTFVRPGEARLAQVAEFDLDHAIWHIPAGRMKMRRPHEVPLSRQAIALIRQARSAAPESPLLFPSLRSTTKPLSDNAANAALRGLGYSADQMVAHGFRSSASTILNRRGFNRDVIEMQLAHAPEDRIRAIYNRDKMWSDRVNLMQRWADLLDGFKLL